MSSGFLGWGATKKDLRALVLTGARREELGALGSMRLKKGAKGEPAKRVNHRRTGRRHRAGHGPQAERHRRGIKYKLSIERGGVEFFTREALRKRFARDA